MRTILEIIKKEFYQIRHDRRILGIAIVLPLIQVLLLGYAATLDVVNSPLVVCDMDKTPTSRAFVRQFTSSGHFVEKYTVNDPRGSDAYLDNGRARVALVISRRFGDRVLARTPAQVQVLVDGTDANTANILLGYASQIIAQYTQSAVAEHAILRLGSGPGRVIPEPRVWFNPDLRSANYMVPGVLALVLMIVTMTLTSAAVVREKEMGTLEQLMVTPIRPYQLIVGKLLPFTLVGFVDVVGVLAIAHFWFEVPLRGSLVLLFALSSLFILNTLGLGLFISTIAKSQQQAMLIAQFFFFMPFLYLSGFTFPIENMPEVVQYVTYLIPLRYFLEIIRGLLLRGSDIRVLWPQALILFLFGVSILTLSILRFRKKLE